MASVNIFEQRDFSGGLNLRADQFQLADNESPSLLNVEIDPRGGIFSRGGMTRMNPDNISGTWAPQKLYNFTSANRLLVTTATNVYYDSTSNNFAVLNHASGAVTANSPHGACIIEWGDVVYIATGANATAGSYMWNGSGNAVAVNRSSYNPHPWQATPTPAQSAMPQCEHLCVHANKVFAAQTTENVSGSDIHYSNRIRWSLDGIATNWNQDDYIDISGGGDGITAMVSIKGQLVIFKPHAIYVLAGSDTDSFRLAELSTKVGCGDHHHMAVSDSGVFFYSNNNGLYYYDGASLRNIFEPLKSMFDLGYVNTNAEENISVSWMGKRVWLSLPYSRQYSPTNVTVNFVYDPYLNAYTMFQTADGYGVLGGIDFRTTQNQEWRLALHPTVPCVLRVDNYGDAYDQIAVGGATSGFASYYRTKWHDGGTHLQRKMFRRPDFVLREAQNEQDISVYVYQDFDEQSAQKTFSINQGSVAGAIWDDSVWGDGTATYDSTWATDVQGSLIYSGSNLGLCKAVQLQFNGPTGYDWGINSIGFKYNPRRIKG